MGRAKAVSAGRGFIVKMAGDWFRVPKKLVKDGKVDLGDLRKHIDAQKAARESKGKKYAKPSRRDMFLGKTPGHGSDVGSTVKKNMGDNYRKKVIDGETVEHVQYPPGSGDWYPIDKCDMAHKVDAVDFWNNGAPPKYPRPGRESGPRSDYVRQFMNDPSMYALQPMRPNRSAGATLGQNYRDPS